MSADPDTNPLLAKEGATEETYHPVFVGNEADGIPFITNTLIDYLKQVWKIEISQENIVVQDLHSTRSSLLYKVEFSNVIKINDKEITSAVIAKKSRFLEAFDPTGQVVIEPKPDYIITNEAKALYFLDGKHSPILYGYVQDVLLIMELLPIKHKLDEALDTKDVNDFKAISLQLGLVLEDLYGLGIVHLDPSYNNFVINNSSQVIVLDWGVYTQKLEPPKTLKTLTHATPFDLFYSKTTITIDKLIDMGLFNSYKDSIPKSGNVSLTKADYELHFKMCKNYSRLFTQILIFNKLFKNTNNFEIKLPIFDAKGEVKIEFIEALSKLEPAFKLSSDWKEKITEWLNFIGRSFNSGKEIPDETLVNRLNNLFKIIDL